VQWSRNTQHELRVKVLQNMQVIVDAKAVYVSVRFVAMIHCVVVTAKGHYISFIVVCY
jgi:hypothetical protein